MLKRFISMLTATLVILATLPVFVSAPAHAWTHGTAAACPFPTDNGCAAAPAHGSFKSASLLTSAQQSGQNSLLPTHPMNFNIPGVDYGIGPDSTLTPQDPRTINTSTCQYTGTPPHDFVQCFPVSTGAVTNISLNNYDFGGTKIGKSTIGLFIGGSPGVGSTFTVTNSYFSLFPGDTDSAFAFGGNVGQQIANWSIVYKNNQCDGTNATNTPNNGSNFCIASDGDNPGTSIDIEYNAFTNQGAGRVAAGFRSMTYTMKYNFVEGLNSKNTGNHGEIMLRTCSQTGCSSFDYYEGNFIVWDPVTYTSGNGSNATVFPGDGASHGISLTSFGFINNVIVTNDQPSTTNPVVDQALFNARLATLGAVTMTGNWADASGAGGCSINGVKSGGSTVTASSSGNTLTVTGLSGSFANFPIEPGWLIIHSGFTTTPITAYGTGSGNTGTYTFGGATQTVGSDSLWTLVPGFTSQTLSDNWNLNDPSHAGLPTAIGLSGPQMTASFCQT